MDKSTSLDHVIQEETASLLSSFAVHQSLKEQGLMQSLTTAKMLEELTPIVGASEEVSLTAGELAGLEAFRETTGVADATAEGVVPPARALTKKQQKAAKHAQKNMMRQIKQYQRQGQAAHIMNKLFQHSIRTPEEVRQIHAHDLAKMELRALLGDRQAEAFFKSPADTKTHDFFPKVTIDANPKLMVAANGESRTLAQIFEYFIYKHFMLLTEQEKVEVAGPLKTSIDWAEVGDIPKYIPYEEKAVEEAQPATAEKEEAAQEA